jgi:hypothetical protein
MSLFAESADYKLSGKESALVKGLGKDAQKITPGSLLPSRSLVSSDKSTIVIKQEEGGAVINLLPDSVIEHLGEDSLETEQWFLYRGQLSVTNKAPLLIKMGVAEALLFPGETSLVLEESHLQIKSIKGGLMLTTPKRVEGLKAGQSAKVTSAGMINVSGKESMDQVGAKTLEDRYHLLGLRFKDIKTKRTGLFDGLSFSNKKEAQSSIMRLLGRHKWKSLLEKGREQIFIQDLIGLKEENVILPKSMIKHFYDKPETKAFFEDLAKADKEVSQLSAVEKDEVIFFVRQNMSDPMLAHYDIADAFKYSLRATVSHNSNITQTPEGLSLPSGSEGVSLTTSLTVNYKSREWEKGVTSAKFSVLDLTYFDDSFESRQFSKVLTEVDHSFDLGKKSLISTIKPTLGFDFDFLNTTGSREYTFLTIKPRLDLIAQPINEALWGKLDMLILYSKLGVDVRKYSKNKTILGEKKDSITPYLTLIGIGLKKLEEYDHKMVLLLNARLADSDSDIYDYDTYRVDYIHGISRGEYTVEPSIAYGYRDQKNFFFQARKEDTFEYGLRFKRNFERINSELSFGYRHIRTVSTRSSSSYEDNQISGGLYVRF